MASTITSTMAGLPSEARRAQEGHDPKKACRGSPGNGIGVGVVGATIAGGGATNLFSAPHPNAVLDDFGAIGGGQKNTAGFQSNVAGGAENSASGGSSSVGGGLHNTASGLASTVGGGNLNVASGRDATVPGVY